MDTFDRLVGRWSAIVGLIAGYGAMLTFAAGVLAEIKHFPLWAKIPLIAFAAVFLIVIAARQLVSFRHRSDEAELMAVSQTLVHAADGASLGSVVATGNVMTVGGMAGQRTSASPRRLARLTEARQKALAEEGRALAARIADFGVERRRNEPRHPFALPGVGREQHLSEPNEREERYRAESRAQYEGFLPEIAEYLDAVQEAGFALDGSVSRYASWAGPNPAGETASALRVLAGRVARYRRPWWALWGSRA